MVKFTRALSPMAIASVLLLVQDAAAAIVPRQSETDSKPQNDRMQLMDVTPNLPTHPDSTKYCTWWWENDGSVPCKDMPARWGISMDDWLRWNPGLGSACSNFATGQSYCVEATGEPPVTNTVPGGTGPTNSVETPSPIQPGMVQNCNKFAFVDQGKTCAEISSENGITTAQLIQFNPGVGAGCTTMWAKVYVCVSVTGSAPSPTTPEPTNGIATPSPIQSGLVKNCNKFHLVQTTTTCASIENYYKLPLATFHQWNPAVGTDCKSLLPRYYVCVMTVDYKPGTTPTAPSNGITTPSPIQGNMHKNCNKFHLVQSTTTCNSINNYYNLPLSDFHSWNPSVGSNCQSLMAGYYVCVSIVGWSPPKPSPTAPSNGISTPSPIQPNMVKNCKKFHLVQATTTCSSIQNYYKITMAQIAKWNPAVGSDCKALWKDYHVCVAA